MNHCLTSQQEQIFSITDLNQLSRQVLEKTIGTIWVTGEVSNLAIPASGHAYFSLKDEGAQVRCAFFKQKATKVDFRLENGQQILARAKVSLYAPRGDYQLIIQDLQLAGEGLLQIKFEKLKQRLQKEGLFDPALKKPIPTLPQQIGIISSPTAAALRDILQVLRRRFASIPIIIYPTLVQGNQAPVKLCGAINIANKRAECDVLILARGGGSLEDLWCFNDETLARTIVASDIPIVTGIGHEVDYTIADFAASLRAATPSAAAEICSPDKNEWIKRLSSSQTHMLNLIQSQLQKCKITISQLQSRIQHPRDKIQNNVQKIDQLEFRMTLLIKQQLSTSREKLSHLAKALNNLSPLSTLERGYCMALTDNGSLITSVKETPLNTPFQLRFHDGVTTAIPIEIAPLEID